MALDPTDGWQKYSELAISNPNSDYQMRLDIRRGTGTNDLQNGIIYDDNNCYYDDLRDVQVNSTDDPTGGTRLPQWAEYVESGVKRVIWIKTNGNSSIYLFVGNQNASEYSDGDATFIFFDDFDTDTTGNYTPKTDSKNDAHFAENVLSDVPAIIEYRFKISKWDADSQWGTSQDVGFADDIAVTPNNMRTAGTGADADYADNSHLGVIINNRKDASNNIIKSGKSDVPFSLNTYYSYIIKINNTEIKMHLYDDDRVTEIYSLSNSNNIPTATLPHLILRQYRGSESGSAWAFEWDGSTNLRWYGKRNGFTEQEKYMDWIFVRKYADPEPSWSNFGAWTEISEEVTKTKIIEAITALMERKNKTINAISTIFDKINKQIDALGCIATQNNKSIESLTGLYIKNILSGEAKASIFQKNNKSIQSATYIIERILKEAEALTAIYQKKNKSIEVLATLKTIFLSATEAKANIYQKEIKNIEAIANLYNLNLSTIEALTNVIERKQKNTEALAALKMIYTMNINSGATIYQKNIKDIVASAAIFSKQTKTIEALAYIRASAMKTIEALANIYSISLKAITGLATISEKNDAVIEAITFLAERNNKIIEAITDIYKIKLKQLEALATTYKRNNLSIDAMAVLYEKINKQIEVLTYIRGENQLVIEALSNIAERNNKMVEAITFLAERNNKVIEAITTLKETLYREVEAKTTIWHKPILPVEALALIFEQQQERPEFKHKITIGVNKALSREVNINRRYSIDIGG